MNKSPQYNQQKLRKYLFTKTWKVAVTASISPCENKKNGFHAKEPQATNITYLKVVTFSDASFSKKRIYVYVHAAQITHRKDHPVHEKVLIFGKN